MSEWDGKTLAALNSGWTALPCNNHPFAVLHIAQVGCALCYIRELEAKLEEVDRYVAKISNESDDVIDALEEKLARLTSRGIEDMRDTIDQQSDSIDKLKAENGRMRESLINLRECNWVITLPDRMDAVREIAREALGD